MSLQTGSVLNNRYRIVQMLGKGGFGAVYRAWDISLNKACAVKENLEISLEAQRQFNREATLLANLSHPNLPRVTDYFLIPNQGQYLVMDYVEGEDLQTMLTRLGKPLAETQVIQWIGQICDALAYLHSQNPPIIHRDIKPANIKITPSGQAILVDFGIAKTYHPHLQTTQGARAITIGYSPPEQYGEGTTDIRSDIYALGATLYTLVTGQPPLESVQRSLGRDITLPRAINPSLPQHLEGAILKAMQLQPDKRFQSAVEFKTALTTIGQPPHVVRVAPTAAVRSAEATPVAATKTAISWGCLGVGGLVALAGVALLGVVFGVFFLLSNRDVTPTATGQVTLPGLNASPTILPTQDSRPTNTPYFPPPTFTLPPTVTPVAEIPTSTPVLSPAIVEPYCSMFNQSPVYVRIHQSVILWWRWDAKTKEQVQDHIEAAHYEIYLDGVFITAERMSEIEYLKDKGYYRVSWYANVGALSPGTHRAERILTWSRMITDGWNTFGPGGKIETESHYCVIIVQ